MRCYGYFCSLTCLFGRASYGNSQEIAENDSNRDNPLYSLLDMYRATGLHGAMPDSVLREIDCLLLDEGHPGNKIQVKCWTVTELSNHKLLISKSGTIAT